MRSKLQRAMMLNSAPPRSLGLPALDRLERAERELCPGPERLRCGPRRLLDLEE